MKPMKLIAVLLIATVAAAQELPVVFPVAGEHTADRSDAGQDITRQPAVPVPAWHRLAQLTSAERTNACISVELPAAASNEALELARLIQETWNNGNFEHALNLFEELSRLVNPQFISIGCSWREPIPTIGTDWGNDVRVGNRDSIYCIQLDIHRASGNLLAVLAYTEGGTWYWSMNISTNGGTSWSETFTWWAGFPVLAVNAAVLGADCYVSYEHAPNHSILRLRRCYASNGAEHLFQGGQNFVTVAEYSGADSIFQTAICSNQDFYDNRLYILPLLYSGKIHYYWDDTSAVSWDSTPDPGITDALHGIDATCNEGYDSTFIWFSYVATDNNVKIVGRRGTGWRTFISYPSDPGAADAHTAIGAWRDTVLCAFVYPGAVAGHVRYLVNYQGGNPGSTWYYLHVGGDSMTRSEAPDVALRDGGGSAIIYRYYSDPRELRYVWRRYSGTWSTPVSVADHAPYWNHPAIEYLGGNAYGVLYLTWYSPQYRAAYFDRTDWTGIAEQRRLIMEENILNITPNPLNRNGWLHYTVENPARLIVQLFDRSGRLVTTIYNGETSAGRHSLRFDAARLVPGVYFIRAEANGEVLTLPFSVVH
ncbi:MAG: T9SS type A sorting domain-containing protein [candidate division WOR-3 bacterium]